ncbi:MAG: DUF5615 family PIN-like protein [Saprospiraceae bacterium]
MRLLLDNNISYRLVKKLKDVVPECLHVSKTGLLRPADDPDIWAWAKRYDHVIVTFDEDFEVLETLYGFPPKVILLRFGNAPTKLIEKVLR